jgi:ABC-type glycerol-3-phosphate transport system substrate-binding protein
LFALLLGGKLFRNLRKTETITVWGTNLSQTNFEQLTASFRASGVNVKIDYTEKNINTYEDDLNNALLGGTPPDIFMINNS